jgi:hypothetical protein
VKHAIAYELCVCQPAIPGFGLNLLSWIALLSNSSAEALDMPITHSRLQSLHGTELPLHWQKFAVLRRCDGLKSQAGYRMRPMRGLSAAPEGGNSYNRRSLFGTRERRLSKQGRLSFLTVSQLGWRVTDCTSLAGTPTAWRQLPLL